MTSFNPTSPTARQNPHRACRHTSPTIPSSSRACRATTTPPSSSRVLGKRKRGEDKPQPADTLTGYEKALLHLDAKRRKQTEEDNSNQWTVQNKQALDSLLKTLLPTNDSLPDNVLLANVKKTMNQLMFNLRTELTNKITKHSKLSGSSQVQLLAHLASLFPHSLPVPPHNSNAQSPASSSQQPAETPANVAMQISNLLQSQ